MSNQFLKLRRSSVPGKVPTTESIDYGEIALNTYDGKAYMKKSGSAGIEVVAIGDGGGGGNTFPYTGSAIITGSLEVSGSSGGFSGITGSLSGTSSYALTASYALNAGGGITGGTNNYIPLWSGSNALTSSILYQSQSIQFNTPSVNVNDLSLWYGDNDVYGFPLNFPTDLGLNFISSTTSSLTVNGDVTLGGSFPLPWIWTNIALTDNSANNVSITDPYYNNISSVTFYSQSFDGVNYTVSYSSSIVPGVQLPNTVYTSVTAGPIVVGVNGSMNITGTLTVTGSITGSLYGTASWAESASWAPQVIGTIGSTIYSITPAAGPNLSTANSLMLGSLAGEGTATATTGNFVYLGNQAGRGVSGSTARDNTFIGTSAGAYATDVTFGFFAGYGTGQGAKNASYSTLIGYNAGLTSFGEEGIGNNNIIIGTNISLPTNSQDSINLGGIIFATGSYSNTATLPFTGSTGGRVGINKITPIYTLDVSGTGNFTNGLTASGSLSARGPILFPSLTTNSNIRHVLTFDTSSGQLYYTASSAVGGTLFPFVGNAIITGSLLVSGSSGGFSGITGSLFGTASYVSGAVFTSTNPALSASFATTASSATTASFAVTASISNTSSFATTASFSRTSITSSYPFSISGSTLYTTYGVQPSNFSTSSNILIGEEAGTNAVTSNNSIYIGKRAGISVTDAYQSTFIGNFAGSSSIEMNNTVLIGQSAGSAGYGYNNVYVGVNAGFSASTIGAVAVGNGAGYGVGGGNSGVYIGSGAGYSARNAANTIAIGANAGTTDGVVSGVGANNIIIGNSITLEAGRQDSINIGGVIFATGSFSQYNSITRFSGSAGGRVGINVVVPTYNFQVSGTVGFPNLTTTNQPNVVTIDTATGQLYYTASSAFGGGGSSTFPYIGTAIITGSLVVSGSSGGFSGITSSLQGTSSWALSASVAPNYLPLTGGTITGNVTLNGTASIAYLNVTYESASVIYSSGSNQLGDATNDIQTLIGTVIVSGSQQITGSLNAPNITGSLFGTASWARNAITASYTPVFPYTGSAVISGSLIVTGSASFNSGTGTTILTTNADTLIITGSLIVTGSSTTIGAHVITGSLTVVTGSSIELQVTNTGVNVGNTITDTHNVTGSLRVSGSITGSLFGTSSWSTNAISASFLPVSTYSITASWAQSASNALNAQTSSNIRGGLATYVPLWNTNTTLTSSYIQQIGSTLESVSSSILGGFAINYAGNDYRFGGQHVNGAYLQITNREVYFHDVQLSGVNGLDLSLSGNQYRFGDFNALSTTGSYLTVDSNNSVIKTVYSTSDIGLKLDYLNGQYTLGDSVDTSYPTRIVVNGSVAAGNSEIQLISNDTAIPSDITVNVNGSGQFIKTTYNGNDRGLSLQFATQEYVLGDATTKLTVDASTPSIKLNGLTSAPQIDVVTIDTATGQLYYTASSAIGGSTVSTLRAGSGSIASFGGTPLTTSVILNPTFSNNAYAITVTGEDARSWTIQNKNSGSFVINSNSTVALTGPVYWIATPFN